MKKIIKKLIKYLISIGEEIERDDMRKDTCSDKSGTCNFLDETHHNTVLGFINSVLTMNKDLYVETSFDMITIRTCTKSNKSSYNDKYLTFYIYKDKMFIERDGFPRITYLTDKMFYDIIDICKKREKEISSETLKNVIDEFMIESGMCRYENIDKLLNL